MNNSTKHFNAGLALVQAQSAHDRAVANREAARNAPLHRRAQLMAKYNAERENANIDIARARVAMGQSNWSTQYRGLEYKTRLG